MNDIYRTYCFLIVTVLFYGYVDSNNHSVHGFGQKPSLLFDGFRLTLANFNKTYSGNVSDNQSSIYEFQYNISSVTTAAVRIYTTSNGSEADFPIMFVIRQEKSVMSWQIPLVLQYSYEHIDVGRTLCPMQNDSHTLQPKQKLYIEVSTQSRKDVFFTLKAMHLNDFLLKPNTDYAITSSPSNPVYYMYRFTDDIESVMVTAQSGDKKCSILSIQDIKCPVFDLAADVVYQGKYQTMTSKGAITVTKSEFSNGAFYVVIVVKSNDEDCSNGFNELHPPGLFHVRQKRLTLHIQETIPSSQYYKAVSAAAGFFLAFYFAALLIGVFYHGCKDRWGIIDLTTFEASMSEEDTRRRILQPSGQGQVYGSIAAASEGAQNSVMTEEASANVNDDRSVDSLNSEEYDFIKDVDHDKDILRTKAVLFVSDLARKSEKRADKSYKLYCKNLFTIAIFYGLPVIQLVMTYQQVLNTTGDQDICYYNFECAHPLGSVSSFNNIFSNIGYIMLGLLFTLLVYRRSWLHKKAVEASEGRHTKIGIPQHFGLFYAMGFALCMEGIMSACYHVCPTVSNFQFDTSFMYIIACLCILKIYQNRHPDISAKAHSSYLVMAVVIIIAVIGVVYGTNIFWVIFAIVYMASSLMLSIHLYYMGRWKLDRYVCKRLWFLFVSDWMKCQKPLYKNRFVLLLLGNIVNWGIALYGGITAPGDFASLLLAVFILNLIIYMVFYIVMKGSVMDYPLFALLDWLPFSFQKLLAIYGAAKKNSSDFASFLLAIFIGNLLLYTSFYILSKLIAREKVPILTWIIIVLAGITWGFALYFFFAHLTSWQLSPAGSREGNQKCVLMEFYDKHDVWHFLSSISLFFSFLVLLTLDDELILMRRDKIQVF